jgi:two-component system sensor histidine kinase CpxA
MYRLFWKIFFLFWIVNGVLFSAGVSLAHLFSDRMEQQRHRSFPIAQIAENAIYAHEVGKMSRFLRRARHRLGVEAWLLDLNGTLLGPERIAPRMPQVDTFPTYIKPSEATGNRHVHSIELEAEDGRRYHFIAAYDVRPPKDNMPSPFQRLMFFLVAIAATSLLIAGFITRPLRRLQRAVRRFASGELDTRVNGVVSCRKDVVGELGREFNSMAERLDSTIEAQRRLMRDISHELRTPLARMQVAATLAEDISEGAEQPLQRIHTEIQRLDALIGQVMALAKLESGTEKLETEPFDLPHMLAQLAADAEFEFAGDGKSVEVKAPQPIVLDGNRMQLRSAVENVLRNAMRHTPNDTPVTIAASRHGDEVDITVRDRGPGVPEANLQRVFDAFFRCEDARDCDSGGHGVGLAITRGVVMAHNGSITADNHPESGLIVRITIPMQYERSTASRVQAADVSLPIPSGKPA